MLKNKETIVQCYVVMLNQNTKKRPGVKFALFDWTGVMEMDNFGYLNSSINFFYIS